jgi:penicillin-binding protein 2
MDGNRTRIAVVGVGVLALFAALLVRLWFLQVGNHETYVQEAETNGVRIAYSPPVRGLILDRDGKPLVQNRTAYQVTIARSVEGDELHTVLARLSNVLEVPKSDLERRRDSVDNNPLLPAVVHDDASQTAVTYIAEHQEDFPGVEVQTTTVRTYPYGSVAAHVLGYSGEINDEELKQHGDGKEPDYRAGDQIGKSGVEASYDADLRGHHGVESLRVDARNRVLETLGSQDAEPGDTVQLTLDLDLQRAVETYLEEGIQAARQEFEEDPETHESTGRTFVANAGAAVVMDARTGAVLAMASNPTYDPQDFIGGISEDKYQQYAQDANTPLFDRAVQGLYPPGSTFKPVTALAAAENGTLSPPWRIINDVNGVYKCCDIPELQQEFKNFEGNIGGEVNLAQALSISNDYFFYTLGGDTAVLPVGLDGDEHIQEKARELSFDAPTGIDLGEEASGRVPDREWLKEFHAAGGTERSDWYFGDTINLAVGQGDLLVTPLQLATAYAAIGNGGTVVTPHLGARVVDAEGKVLRDIAPPGRQVQLDPEVRNIVMLGLRDAVQDPGTPVGHNAGTAYAAFQGFPFDQVSVAGKTGTAEMRGKQDTTWFTALVPADNPHYVVTVAVEQADTGARTSAPIVRKVLEYLYCLPGYEEIPPDPQYGPQPDNGSCAPQTAQPPIVNNQEVTTPTLPPADGDQPSGDVAATLLPPPPPQATGVGAGAAAGRSAAGRSVAGRRGGGRRSAVR